MPNHGIARSSPAVRQPQPDDTGDPSDPPLLGAPPPASPKGGGPASVGGPDPSAPPFAPIEPPSPELALSPVGGSDSSPAASSMSESSPPCGVPLSGRVASAPASRTAP